MTYNFDEIIDRTNTNALSTDGFRGYIFHAGPEMTFPYRDEEFIRMWVADMEFQTPEVIRDAVKARVDRGIFGYTQLTDPAYFAAFSAWCERMYAWVPEREHLVFSTGVIPALYDLVGLLTQPGESVLLQTPSYAYFMHAVDYHRRGMVTSDLINQDGYYTMDYEDFDRKASDPKVKVFVLCSPHNPSGRVWTEAELRKIGEICQKHDLWIVSDEIHCDLLRQGLRHIPLAKVFPENDKIITCMAPSKTFNMAGMQFSNILIPNKALRDLWKDRHIDFLNPLSIAACGAAYAHGEDWLMALRDYLDENFRVAAAYLAENLPHAVFRISEATYLAWLDIRAYVGEREGLPLYFANHAGVLLEGGDMFVRNSAGFIRFNFACPQAVMLEGLRRVCDLLNRDVPHLAPKA